MGCAMRGGDAAVRRLVALHAFPECALLLLPGLRVHFLAPPPMFRSYNSTGCVHASGPSSSSSSRQHAAAAAVLGVEATPPPPPRHALVRSADDGGVRIAAFDQDAPPGAPHSVRAADIPHAALANKRLSAKGIIDAADARAAARAPGLTPLAQARSRVGAWLAAVDHLGPLTALSDPLFAGTVFVPSDEALAGALEAAAAQQQRRKLAQQQPQQQQQQQQQQRQQQQQQQNKQGGGVATSSSGSSGSSGSKGTGAKTAAFSQEAFAAALNALTVPGRPMRAAELRRAAEAEPPDALGGGGLRFPSSARGRSVVVAQLPSADATRLGVAVAGEGEDTAAATATATDTALALAPVVEADLQSGAAVAHVVGRSGAGGSAVQAIFAAAAAHAAAAAARPSGLSRPPRMVHHSAMAALRDGGGVAGGAARFAQLVELAGAAAALSDRRVRLTVFAPSDAALEAWLPPAAWAKLASLPEGRALAEAVVARHWLSGAALGEPALRARAASAVDAAAADGARLALQFEGATFSTFAEAGSAGGGDGSGGNDSESGAADRSTPEEGAGSSSSSSSSGDSSSSSGSGDAQVAEQARRQAEFEALVAAAITKRQRQVEAEQRARAGASGGGAADGRLQPPTGADGRPLLGGPLLVGGRRFVAVDAALAPRAAVHVIDGLASAAAARGGGGSGADADAELEAARGAFLKAAGLEADALSSGGASGDAVARSAEASSALSSPRDPPAAAWTAVIATAVAAAAAALV